MAFWNRFDSAGAASAQMTMTSAAVIKVMSTQPGTSPRSDARSRRMRAQICDRIRRSCRFPHHARRNSPQAFTWIGRSAHAGSGCKVAG